jgi:hypothetical protein
MTKKSIPKRWFRVSHDINQDPQFDELCDQFGVAGVRFWLLTLSILNRTGNQWSLHNNQFNLKNLAHSCRTKPKIILSCYQFLIDLKWISVGLDSDLNQIIYAPNYLKYNETDPSTRLDYNNQHKNVDKKGGVPPLAASQRTPPTAVVKKLKNRKPPDLTVEELETRIQAIIQRDGWRNDREEPAFEALWDHWPKKAKKLEAKLAWLEMRPTAEQCWVVLDQIEAHKKRDEWVGDQAKYCPRLDTYLREKRWLDGV